MNLIFYFISKVNIVIFLISLKFKRKYYPYLVRRNAKQVGKGLKVNGKSVVNRFTVLGDNVNFNGMTVMGLGEVFIGNNFHSGQNCIIINSYHNYDNGTKILYDSTYIHKKVVIEDNVWIGSNVTILY